MNWPASKANRVLAALLRIGWSVKRQSGTSHRVCYNATAGQILFSRFTSKKKIGLRMLARIAKRTGLTPNDL
jgi:predicted RNA binding protein YcfA (HicA-like mRNA interferase family)